MSILKKEFLTEQIAHHSERVEAHVLAYARAQSQGRDTAEVFLAAAAQHAAVFNALTAILAAK